MNLEEIPINNNLIIKPDSEVLYASSVGIGEDKNEIRLILINKKLVNNKNDLELINESNLQIILNKKTAKDLKNLLDDYFEE
ncbi:hypothetical protein [Methanobrevibacter olleyae]|uniref:Uncharacterized protein n=1 Tax=Methanobrevibacter olleyae TaxID=294671 RepID=A0A126R0J6_METOL|nr:hypothetical protein [Methanobrevibacter olleyae]AMK15576.1 hypothetical protein YLM1_1019 [Methanobrevibacter olleyae]SFL81986.1 hypothetical protein SAMN02910297_01829 [Methanobrevibacter olleyae]